MSHIYRVDLPNIMHEMIEKEVVVVNLDNGTYYSFDGVGGQIWQLLSGKGRSLVSLTTKIASLYSMEQATISAAIERFVSRLSDEQLISVLTDEDDTTGAIGEESSATPLSAKFADPVLQKYTDMENLLLADPIHEVEDTGWPKLK